MTPPERTPPATTPPETTPPRRAYPGQPAAERDDPAAGPPRTFADETRQAAAYERGLAVKGLIVLALLAVLVALRLAGI